MKDNDSSRRRARPLRYDDGSDDRRGRPRGHRILLVLAVIAAAVAGLGHMMGGGTSVRVLAVAGAGLAALLALWRYSHLMRHFHPFGLRQRQQRARARTTSFRHTGSLNYPGQKGKGFRQPSRPSGRRSGSAFRRVGSARRRAAAAPGNLVRRNRRGAGQSSTRRAGAARRHRPGSPRIPGRAGAARRGSAFRRAGAARRSGARRLLPVSRRAGSARRGSGRRLSPGSRRIRPVSRFPGRIRRGSRILPQSRRRGPGRKVTRPQAVPRSLRRPLSWLRRRPRAAGTPQAGPGRHRRRAGTNPGSLPAPGRIRRAWHRRAGTPQQRHNRRAARLARRSRLRAWRRKLQANPYAHRVRWYAPWRLWTRGPGLRSQFRRWRARRGHVVPHGGPREHRYRLSRAARIARRRHIRRGTHPGLGKTPAVLPLRDRLSPRMLAARARRLRRRVRLRRWLARRVRNRPPPKPLTRLARGGRHSSRARTLDRFRRSLIGRQVTRLDRWRMDRWARRRRRNAPVPVPQPLVPAKASSGILPGRTGMRGGRKVDTGAMADQIRELGGSDFADPQDVHDTIAGVHELVGALQETLAGIGERLGETGAHPAYSEAVQEAAGAMSGIADELQGVTSGGVMRGPGE